MRTSPEWKRESDSSITIIGLISGMPWKGAQDCCFQEMEPASRGQQEQQHFPTCTGHDLGKLFHDKFKMMPLNLKDNIYFQKIF